MAQSVQADHAALDCSANTSDIDSDKGGYVAVRVAGRSFGGPVSCTLAIAWDGWVLTTGNDENDRLEKSVGRSRSGASEVVCEIPPHGGEGPVMLRVAANVTVDGSTVTQACAPIPLWYSTRLVASFGESPYFAADEGELLVRTNLTAPEVVHQVKSAWHLLRLRATAPDGQVLAENPLLRNAIRSTLTVQFQGLDPAFKGSVLLELLCDGSLIAKRNVSLVRVPERPRGRTSVDHKRRSLLVEGRPFFPIGWFSTYLSFGEEATLKSLEDIARKGGNSMMLYDLFGSGANSSIFTDRGETPSSPRRLLDAAAAFGIKVQMYLLDLARPLSNGDNSYWDQLDEVVRTWRHHPAVLSWYIADDSAGPYLPDVYRRIKQLDPHHLVTMAIAGSGDSYRTKYMEGTDVIMLETYPRDAEFAYATMNVISRWPLEFMPAVTCGRAWSVDEDHGIITPEVFRSQLYHALIAGATGEVWFAYRNARGWNNPGLAIDAAAFQATQQILDLAPALMSPGLYSSKSIPPPVSVRARFLDMREGEPDDTPETAVRARAFREENGCVTLLIASGVNRPVKASVQFQLGSDGIFDDISNMSAALPFFELALPRRIVPVDQGKLEEVLPPLGVQTFRLRGTGPDTGCGEPELDLGTLEISNLRIQPKPNLVYNPSFEQFGAYISSPLYWDCGMGPLTTSTCFADASVRTERRHSGRFVTGLNATAFYVKPSIAWSDTLPLHGRYEFSIWAQADVPMTLKFGVGGNGALKFEEMAAMELSETWKQLHLEINLVRNSAVVFKVNTTGVLWLDDMQIRSRSSIAINLP